jgi:two-component system nitrate/nitrite response regulator NarL
MPAARGNKEQPRARVFLLSDVRLYREGLLLSLQRRDVFDVLGADRLSDGIVAHIAALKADAVILDMGARNGFSVARQLNSTAPATKIVAFAVNEIDHLVLACAEAGVAGYVAPDATEEDLENAVHFALRGELYCSAGIAGLLFRRVGVLAAKPVKSSAPETLTVRERQILDLVSEGMSNKEISRALRISNATVKNHVHNILDKLQLRRRGEAAAWARGIKSSHRSPADSGAAGLRPPRHRSAVERIGVE